MLGLEYTAMPGFENALASLHHASRLYGVELLASIRLEPE